MVNKAIRLTISVGRGLLLVLWIAYCYWFYPQLHVDPAMNQGLKYITFHYKKCSWSILICGSIMVRKSINQSNRWLILRRFLLGLPSFGSQARSILRFKSWSIFCSQRSSCPCQRSVASVPLQSTDSNASRPNAWASSCPIEPSMKNQSFSEILSHPIVLVLYIYIYMFGLWPPYLGPVSLGGVLSLLPAARVSAAADF